MNGTAAVTLLAAPAASKQRITPRAGVSVYNKDTVPHDITFQKNVGGTVHEIEKQVGVVPGGMAILSKIVVLDAVNMSLEGKTDATAATTEPKFDVAGMETS